MHSIPIHMANRSPETWKRRLKWWLPFGVRWILAFTIAFGVVLAWLLTAIHPSQNDGKLIVLYLTATSVSGIVLGSATLWWIQASNQSALWLKLSLPAMLSVIMIAFNVIVVARLMFISGEDSQLVLAFLAFGILIALVLSLSLAGAVSRSLHQIINGAQQIAAGNYAARIQPNPLTSISEMRRLADAFNQMAASISDAFDQRQIAEQSRRDIVAALSHDVRTPLTSVRAMLEAIDDGLVTDSAIIRRYHAAMRVEVGHLGVLLDDLFEISCIEAGTLNLKLTRIDIGDIISDILDATHEEAERAGIALSGINAQVPAILADTRQVYRILMNLTRNALHHTPSGGCIQISTSASMTQPAFITVHVCDTGSGIDPVDLPHIFRMAYRGDASRRRTAPPDQSGAGLGLAIARGLVEAHKGSIGVQSPLPDNMRVALGMKGQDGPGTLIWFTLSCAAPIERGAL